MNSLWIKKNVESTDGKWQERWLEARRLYDEGRDDEAMILVENMMLPEMKRRTAEKGFKPEDADDVLAKARMEIWMHFGEFNPYFIAISAKKVSRAKAEGLINADEERYLLLKEREINGNIREAEALFTKVKEIFPHLNMELRAQTGVSFCLAKLTKAQSEMDAYVKHVSRSVRDRQRQLEQGKVAAKKQSTIDKLTQLQQMRFPVPIDNFGDSKNDLEDTCKLTVPPQLRSQSAEDAYLASEEEEISRDVDEILEMGTQLLKGLGDSEKLSKYAKTKIQKTFLCTMFRGMGLEVPYWVLNDEKKRKDALKYGLITQEEYEHAVKQS